MRAPWRDRQGRVSALKLLALAGAVVPAVVMAWDWRTGFFGPLPVVGLVYWSGVWAAAMLLVTLAVTPARHVLRLGALIETRRILGVAALAYSLAHTVAFFALLRWNWTAILNEATGRISLVVACVALAGLLVLGATSTDAAVARLGGARWQRLHTLNYALTALAIGHFLLSPGIFSLQYTMAGLLFWLLAWRALRARGPSPGWPGLVALTLASALFAFAVQVAWLWAWQKMPPSETLDMLASFDDEIPPPWAIVAAGLAATIVATGRRWRAAPA